MKIYKLSYHEAEEGTVISYHTSRGKAERFLRDIKREAEHPNRIDFHDVYVYEIPATKAGFLIFLNHHTPGHDNG